jgi:thioredoxin 1
MNLKILILKILTLKNLTLKLLFFIIFIKGEQYSMDNNDQLLELTDQNFAESVLSNPLPVVVDFWAPWCGPCKMLTPIIHELAAEYAGRVTIGKLNIDNTPAIAAKYGIETIPTLLFFSKGNLLGRQVGLLAKAPLKAKIDDAFKV